jgi:hypothetical protein
VRGLAVQLPLLPQQIGVAVVAGEGSGRGGGGTAEVVEGGVAEGHQVQTGVLLQRVGYPQGLLFVGVEHLLGDHSLGGVFLSGQVGGVFVVVYEDGLGEQVEDGVFDTFVVVVDHFGGAFWVGRGVLARSCSVQRYWRERVLRCDYTRVSWRNL